MLLFCGGKPFFFSSTDKLLRFFETLKLLSKLPKDGKFTLFMPNIV